VITREARVTREDFIRAEWKDEYPTAPSTALDRAVQLSMEGLRLAERGESSFEKARMRGARIHRMLANASTSSVGPH
jgi:hypothetical protein